MIPKGLAPRLDLDPGVGTGFPTRSCSSASTPQRALTVQRQAEALPHVQALAITGRCAALPAMVRAARSWWRSRSQVEFLRWRIAAAARGAHRRRVSIDLGVVRVGLGLPQRLRVAVAPRGLPAAS